MNPLDDRREDEQIEALLSAAARDAAPPDPAFLARLRQQSTDVFQVASQSSLARKPRGRLMTTRILNALAAALLLAVLGGGLYWSFVRLHADPDLEEVLENVNHARSIHFQIIRAGQTSEVWAEPDGRLRRDEPDGTYQIATDGQLWRIDEKANRATSAKSPYHRGDRHELDLFALLGLAAKPDGASRPIGQTERDGHDCLVYQLEAQAEDNLVEIEALVDRPTRLLRHLQVRERRNGGIRPIAELNVVAYNEAIAEEKFVVRDTLTEDGRVGKLTDVQGIVGVRPALHQRWTPARANLILEPADWLRTDRRGANAAELRLVKRTRIILGPGSLVEVVKPEQIRLIEGELEITVPKNAKLELLGPDKKPIAVKGTKRYRIRKEAVVTVADEPRWLQAFKGKTSDESIGSLIAKVDGRNVPLTVGQHKVTVDIRDQIARTVIEESFVNHTNGVLEGVFHFPLPPGASISGFAMWVGDKLVEADIVEKQRAREIYETILQEKRDPGLLEWTGGNIFKARVYPIFANSEKRIKITYTQVLPQKGGQYRYSYNLQSEMLQQHPLRELAIDVKIHSAAPLQNVACPTHPTRLDRTEHSAHLEFTAQEYSPTRDFEVVIETKGKQSDLVLIPHRRGDDGYFMLQLTPPAAGDWVRDLLPDGEPLHLLILADTSASMDSRQRKAQANFIAALVSCLTSADRVNLAACDVECDWVFEHAVNAEPGNIAAMHDYLARRTSLGWTDLDRAFASVFKQCEPETQVIYVGDGILTTGNGDAVAFTKRLRRLFEQRGKIGTFHAVSTGSSYEARVLKAIASLGGGSVRHIGADVTPGKLAQELVAEMAEPSLRDLKLEFRGLRTARVYPEELPNLPTGSQQIVLGRYLPENHEQTGEVIVTGTRGGRPVRFHASVALKDAEEGNSFIPRLWARLHLDHLLEQGSSQAIRDEIIALSEEYQIITPYTSLLVLESDADRERFKVKRTFRMRDGEKFFAQGRDNADYELKQQQMRRAEAWRRGLRNMVMRQLATLGRDSRWFQTPELSRTRWKDRSRKEGEEGEVLLMGEIGERGLHGSAVNDDVPELKTADLGGEHFEREAGGAAGPVAAGKPQDRSGIYDPYNPDSGSLDETSAEKDVKRLDGQRDEMDAADKELMDGRIDTARVIEDAPSGPAAFFGLPRGGRGLGGMGMMGMGGGMMGMDVRQSLRDFDYFGRGRRGPGWDVQQSQWLASLFPALPSEGKRTQQPQSTWPAEARELARSLLRRGQLTRMQGGLEIIAQTESFDVRWNELSSRSRLLALLSSGGWLIRSQGDGQQTLVQWCNSRERGVFSQPYQLGRLRKAQPVDVVHPPLDLQDFAFTALDEAYHLYIPRLEPQGEGKMLLELMNSSSPFYTTRLLIDTKRHVLLHIEHLQNGKRSAITRFGDFVEIGGCRWARTMEAADGEGRVTGRGTRAIQARTVEALAKQTKGELAGRDGVLFLHMPAKSVAEAKRAVAAGKATFDDSFTLLRYFAGRQQWTRAAEQMQKCDKAVEDKPGIRWLRYALLLTSRRHEELRKQWLDEANRLAKAKPADSAGSDDVVLADHLVSQGWQILQANEMLTLLDQLKPIYARQPAHRQSTKHWMQQRLGALQQTGRWDEALRLQKQLAVDWPRDYGLQQQYAQALANGGDYPAAYAWLNRVLGDKARWLPQEEDSLRSSYTQLLEAQGRYPELLDYLADWQKHEPETTTAYAQYLSALVRTDQLDKAGSLVKHWLRLGSASGELWPAAQARLQAAVSLALGQGHNLYTSRIEENWLKPLADTALALVRQDDKLSLAAQILGHWQFQQSDEAPRVRKVLMTELAAGIDKLAPERIANHVQWITTDNPAAWKPIVEGLRKRWVTEQDAWKKHQLGQSLVQVLRRQGDTPALFAFLHNQAKDGPETYRASYASELFTALLEQPWSVEYEDEAFALLGRLSNAADQGERLRQQVAALYRFTDRMIAARREAAMKAVEHPEKLSRIELRKKQAEALRQARAGFAARLKIAADKERGPLAAWLKIERLYLLTQLDQDLPQVAAACWEVLGAEPPPVAEETQETNAHQLDNMLRNRCLLTLMDLAARKGADPALTARLENYIDKGIAREEHGQHFKQMQYWLLIAQDRPKDLEKTLAAWVRADAADNAWRLSLAYVLAEQGRIPEAIKMLEAIAGSDDLPPTAYRTLADWYLAANRREQYEKARLAAFKTVDEWQLHRILNARLWPWMQSNGRTPVEVNADVLGMFTALFEKTSSPQQHMPLLQQYYQATHDFRLLTALADAALGHTAEQVYPFLGSLSTVFAEVDEAAVDQLAAHLMKIRPRAQTTVDRRALDLLNCLNQRRASERKNQPGPHAEAALAALRRAAKDEWLPGEPRLLADFLASMGAIPQEPLAKEQLRQLQALHRRAAKGSFDRLHIALRYANTLHAQRKTEPAIALLQSALEEYEEANEGILPPAANDALGTLVVYLEGPRHFGRGEKLLFAQLRHPAHEQQRYWLIRRLYGLYHTALTSDGEVSLGRGRKLYQAVERKLRGELGLKDPEQRRQLIDQLCRIYSTAHEKKWASADEDLRTFAFKLLPELLTPETNNYQNITLGVAQTVHNILGPRNGVGFLLAQIGHEPMWFRFNNQDGWSQFGWYLAQWKEEAKNLGDQEQPLLKVVLAELRRDLQSRQYRNRVLYHRNNGYYWAARESDFAKVAEDVLAKQARSGSAIHYIADYLYDGLNHYARAIEVLLAAHQGGILNDDGQSRLVDMLQAQHRHAEAVPLLEALVKRRPTMLHDRVRLLRAYFYTKRPQELLALLKETDAFFHKKDLWNEGTITQLGAVCLDTQLYAESMAYYNEAISRHQRTQPGRGIGNGVLSSSYAQLARACSGLGKTDEAVDAASGAIISWGPTHHNRAQAIEALKQVLREAPNLDAYVRARDKQTASSGMDSSVIRKALGQVYLERGATQKAIVQLQLAIALTPNDVEVYRLLTDCYDRQNDKGNAIFALLQAAETSRRDIKLYQDLGRRLADQPREAERAYTSIVEVMPSESEGHALLAEIRQQQNRWQEAGTQWEQVARLRALEPTGLLNLAAVQIHLGQWEPAKQTLGKLRSHTWPPRFGNVSNQVRQLADQIEKDRKR